MTRRQRFWPKGACVARLRIADLARMVAAWVTAALALMVAVDVLPGLSATSTWSIFVTAAVAGGVGILVRPLMVGVAARFGWWAVATLAVAGQAVVMQVALELVPGVDSTSFGSTLAA